MKQILAAIEAEIKAEALKESIDLARLKNLATLGSHVKSMDISSLEEMPNDIREFGSMGSPRPVAMATPYVPPLERIMSEYLPQVMPLATAFSYTREISALADLAGRYTALMDKDPELAKQLREKIEEILGKEVQNEDIHTELPR